MKDLIEKTPGAKASIRAATHLSGARVVAVLFSDYPADPRPRRAAEALAEAGACVEVICLKEKDEETQRETFHGVHITRLPLRRRRGGKLSYMLRYGAFILLAGAILAGRTLKRRYDLVHVHNMPDILVFSALAPKLFGAELILDLHDPMPELMMTIFGLREESFPVWLLKKFEAWSISFADSVLTTNEAFRKLFLSRGCPPQKISVVMNSPDEEIFQYQKPFRQVSTVRDGSKPFVMMYHGSLVERHGVDLAVAAVGKIRLKIPGAELRIYGRSTPFLEGVLDLVRKSKLSDAVRYLGPMKLEQIPAAIRECDVGVVPNRRSAFTEINMPTRIFEYLSQGKPVIAPQTPGIQDYFSPQELVLFDLGKTEDLAAKMEYVFEHPEEMLRMVELGQRVYQDHQWTGERERFVKLVEELLTR
ncbi:MAG TPA: glycosyltransferase family 4 protein [Chthoniobacterales bacterium]|nr:glycosyltransferase family 4 protein [Chthoniobacterales bacterium]